MDLSMNAARKCISNIAKVLLTKKTDNLYVFMCRSDADVTTKYAYDIKIFDPQIYTLLRYWQCSERFIDIKIDDYQYLCMYLDNDDHGVSMIIWKYAT